MEREKALDMALGQIEKQFGKGAIMRMGENAHMQVESISTGALSLDIALGIGGLPRGRVVEIFGPESSGKSTLAMHVVAEAQRNGGICAYVDAEHAMDPVYARAIGVNIDDLLISQPDTGEQALEIADMLIRSGALDVVVIDSVAALTPRAEIEGEMGDSHVGLQARLMSQALRKLTATLNKSNTIAIFINQLREKIGVMFGCFSYDTRVALADGTYEEIGRIVEQELPVEVLSYDPATGEVVARRVVGWFDNGPTDQFLSVTVAEPEGDGRSQFCCTANHQVLTPGGWREAGELVAGDRVLHRVSLRLSELQWQVILGSLMGDGALVPTDDGLAASYHFARETERTEHANWKAALFYEPGGSFGTDPTGACRYELPPLPELAELARALRVGGHRVLSEDYLKALTPLSLAVWYADSGSFEAGAGEPREGAAATARIEIPLGDLHESSCRRLVEHLRDTWGIDGDLVRSSAARGPAVVLAGGAVARFQELVAPFVHPSMAHLLPEPLRGRFEVVPSFAEARDELMPVPVVEVRAEVPAGSRHRFDIEVEGSHNYLADGVVVHNSPETTPGGRALKFYSSVRLDIRRIESIKDGAEVTGNRTRVKVVKNKCAPPFRQAEFDIMYGRGISREGSLLDIAVELGIVKKSGAWYTYEGEQLGQGRENAKTFLAENLEVLVEIDHAVRQQSGIGTLDGQSEVPIGSDPLDDEPISLND